MDKNNESSISSNTLLFNISKDTAGADPFRHAIGKTVKMSQAYENEQRDLKMEVEALRQEIETLKLQNQKHEPFIQKAGEYADLTELAPYAAHELKKAIYVGAPDKKQRKTPSEHPYLL